MSKEPKARKAAARRKRGQAQTSETDSQKRADDSPSGEVPAQRTIEENRACLRWAGELIRADFDRLPKEPEESDRVGHGAYLSIIQEVFKTLYGEAKALPLEDLGRLSRIVAEQRRAELARRKVEAPADDGAGQKDQAADGVHAGIPGPVRTAIRQVYGVTLDAEREAEDGE